MYLVCCKNLYCSKQKHEAVSFFSKNPKQCVNFIDGEEFIFGRGTIDDKQAVLAILENLNRLQQDGNQPSRTFYVAFGHDEEVSGHQGAAHISTILKQKLIESK